MIKVEGGGHIPQVAPLPPPTAGRDNVPAPSTNSTITKASPAPSLFKRVFNWLLETYLNIYHYFFPKAEEKGQKEEAEVEPEFKVDRAVAQMIQQMPKSLEVSKTGKAGKIIFGGLSSSIMSYLFSSPTLLAAFIAHQALEEGKTALYTRFDKKNPDIHPSGKEQKALAISSAFVFLSSYPLWYLYSTWSNEVCYESWREAGSPLGLVFLISIGMQIRGLSGVKTN